MSYQVLARKWRPQTFADVVGQGATAETLKNAISQNRIAHAYLFAGTRGVGKTTTARILAKALNCQRGPTVDPCNDCASCREVTSGQAIDVLEIDAASNRGIDEIRELRESVRYRPARDRYKVFIIDEVHMLTTEAFNALLKTLEEPPSHVVFILATTELHKVPGTILSRCQHFNFRAISYREIMQRLAFIASQEKVRIGDHALSAIARASEGSLRDGESLLDQAISLCGQEVEEEQVRDLLGVVPQQLLEDFTDALISRDSKRVLALVDRLLTSGRNPLQLVRELMGHFRNLLMVRIRWHGFRPGRGPGGGSGALGGGQRPTLGGGPHPVFPDSGGNRWRVALVGSSQAASGDGADSPDSGQAPGIPGGVAGGPFRRRPCRESRAVAAARPYALRRPPSPGRHPGLAPARFGCGNHRQGPHPGGRGQGISAGGFNAGTGSGGGCRRRRAQGPVCRRSARPLRNTARPREPGGDREGRLQNSRGGRLRVSLLLEEDQSPVEVSPPPEAQPPPQRILEDERVQRFLKVFEGVPEVRKLK